jgi:uncharacterized protein YfiM (DUF2279 family)
LRGGAPGAGQAIAIGAVAGAIGNRAMGRLLARSPDDPNDPAGYEDLDSYLEGVTVLTEEGARQRWEETHPPAPAPLADPVATIYEIEQTTGRARRISHGTARSRLGLSHEQLENRIGTRTELILRNGGLSTTSTATIEQINDPSKASAAIRPGLEMLQRDAVRNSGRFAADYHVEFSKAVTEAAIAARRSDPDAAVELVAEAYGEEDLSHGQAVLHVFEAIARVNEDNGYDKVQHFIRSMAIHYGYAGLVADAAQYGKEFFKDEVPSWFGSDKGFDWKDMLANNRGQAYGAQLYRRYHPARDRIFHPTHAVEDFERYLTIEIKKLYNVPF